MPVLNIRDVPKEVVRAIKMSVASEGITLHDWVIAACIEKANGKPKRKK